MDMQVRKIIKGEEQELWDLFYNTVNHINSQDYSQSQIASWAPVDYPREQAIKKFRELDPFVVIKNEQIIAYADIQEDGYIDHFYCHHQFQRQGVGSLLFARLEQQAIENGIKKMYSNVSITAKPFFEAKGFDVEKEQRLEMGNEQVKNYRMVRIL